MNARRWVPLVLALSAGPCAYRTHAIPCRNSACVPPYSCVYDAREEDGFCALPAKEVEYSKFECPPGLLVVRLSTDRLPASTQSMSTVCLTPEERDLHTSSCAVSGGPGVSR